MPQQFLASRKVSDAHTNHTATGRRALCTHSRSRACPSCRRGTLHDRSTSVQGAHCGSAYGGSTPTKGCHQRKGVTPFLAKSEKYKEVTRYAKNARNRG